MEIPILKKFKTKFQAYLCLKIVNIWLVLRERNLLKNESFIYQYDSGEWVFILSYVTQEDLDELETNLPISVDFERYMNINRRAKLSAILGEPFQETIDTIYADKIVQLLNKK